MLQRAARTGKIRSADHVAQLGLADQDQLQQLILAALMLVNIRNSSRLSRLMFLRFVEDQDDPMTPRIFADQNS